MLAKTLTPSGGCRSDGVDSNLTAVSSVIVSGGYHSFGTDWRFGLFPSVTSPRYVGAKAPLWIQILSPSPVSNHRLTGAMRCICIL
jgi:hypothetical protein